LAKGKKSKYLDDAQKFVQKQQYDKAIKEYLKAHEEDPKDVKVAQKLGDLYLKTKNQKDSIKFFRMAGSIYARDGFHQRAIAVYRQILEAAPDAFEVRLEVANLYRKLGLMGEAVPHYREALKHYEEAGDKDKSIDIIKNLIDIEPHSVGHRVKLAEFYLKGGQRELGYTEFKKAAEELKSTGRWEDLAKLYEKLIKADPNNFDNLCGYGEALFQKGDLEKSHECYIKALKYKPDDPEILDRLVIVATRLQDVEKAVSYLRKKAQIAEAKNDAAEARSCYQKILKYFPGDDVAKKSIKTLGEEAASETRPAASPSRAPKSKPKPAPVEEETIALESAEEEVLATEEVPRPSPPPPPRPRKPTPPPPPSPAAKSAPPIQKKEEAAEIPTEEQVPRLLTEADVYIRYGLIDKASQYVQRVLRAFPDKHEALRISGLIYKEQGRIQDAVETLLLAISAARAKGDDDDARSYLEEIIDMEPDNAEAQRHLEELNAGVEIDIGVEREEAAAGAEEGEVSLQVEGEETAETPVAHEEHFDLEVESEEPFSFVEEAGEDKLVLVDEEPPAAPIRPAKKPPAPPVKRAAPPAPPPTKEEALLFVEDESAVEEELTLELEPPPAPKAKAAPKKPVPKVAEEEAFSLEEEPELTLEAAPPPPQKAKPAPKKPVLEVEEEALSLESVEEVPEKEKEAIISQKQLSGRDVTVFEEIEEEEEEEEVEIEEITDVVEEEAAKPVSEPLATAPAPSKSLDTVLEDEWGEEEELESAEALEEAAREAEPAVKAHVEEPLIEEHGPIIPRDIDAVAEASEEAWGDAIVDEEPIRVTPQAHPVMEDVAEAADEVLGTVFEEKAPDSAEAGESMFDLSSVLGEDVTQPAPQPEGTADDLGEVLSSFKERVKEEFGGDAETHFNLGIAYKEMELFRDAVHSFETAMKNGYSPSDCLNMIGLSFMDMNEYDKAERVFREGLAQENLQEHEKLGLGFDLGLALENQNRLSEALDCYHEVEALNPHFRDVTKIIRKIAARLKPEEPAAESPRVKTAGSGRSKVSYI